MKVTLLIARASGLLLVAAAILKGIDARETADSFSSHFEFSPALALVTVAALCVLELGLGLWAVVAPRGAAPVMMVLFGAFAGWHVGYWIFAAQAEDPCPCLGRLTLFGSTGPQVYLAPVLALIAAVHFTIAARAARPPARTATGDNHGKPGNP